MFKLLTFFSVAFSCYSEVVFVAEIARHGARVPAQLFPWDKKNKHWLYGKDELTPSGMRQHFLLGQELRQRYVVDQEVLSDTFQVGEVDVLASDLDRTIDSAQSQLRGLYPPSTGPLVSAGAVPPIEVTNLTAIEEALGSAALPYQSTVFPVHVTPIMDDFILRPKYACQTIVNWTAEIATSLVYNTTARASEEVISILEAALPGVDVVSEFIEINNNLKCNLFEGLPLPTQFTPDFVSNASSVFDSVFSLFYSDDDIARLYASALLVDLQQYLEAVASGREGPAFKLYMTNEETVAGVLAGLQVFDLKQPVFASNIIVEVNSGASGFTVRLLYDDKALLVPTCNAIDCPLSTFLSFIDSRVFPDFVEQCNAPTWSRRTQLQIVGASKQEDVVWLGAGFMVIVFSGMYLRKMYGHGRTIAAEHSCRYTKPRV